MVGDQVQPTVYTPRFERSVYISMVCYTRYRESLVKQIIRGRYLKSLPVVMLTGLQVRRGACVCASTCFHFVGLKGGYGSLRRNVRYRVHVVNHVSCERSCGSVFGIQSPESRC